MFKAVSRPLPNLKDWRFSIDQWGIAWAEFDREGESQNALGQRPLEELGEIIAEIEKRGRDKQVVGLVILSGKERGFIVGADIREFADLRTETDVVDKLRPVTGLFDRIENLPIPVVCAINGFCLGGGLELALACHYRIATRDSGTKLGFPEVKLGIFPGFNGTVRAIRQAGAPAAMTVMLTGKMMSASAARAMGLVDQLVESRGALPWAARKAILSKRKSKPAGFAKRMLDVWPVRNLLARRMRDQLSKKAREAHYPAPYRLIDLYETYGGNDEAMKAAESRAFAPLMVSDQSRNLRRVFWLSELLKGQAPKKLDWRPQRVHVIGAGTMGADIAGWCVAAGMEVTLQDVSPEQIAKGIAAQGKLIARKFKTKAQRDAAKTRLIADPAGDGIPRADVVIEAIVEKLDIKRKVLADVEARMKPGSVLATNTSSLQIEDIAAGLADPGRLIGLHFFNPVALMPLVEVVRGTQSREDEVRRGAAFVAAIDKFPLITKSVPGFLVNRVLTPYMFGAMKRLQEGESKERIDEAARAFGMPMGPIELADTVGLDVCAHVAKILNYPSAGSALEQLAAAGKLGKKTGEGFYVWQAGKPIRDPRRTDTEEMEELGRELIQPLIDEAQKSLDAGIVENADLVDAAVIFGTGFAPFRGGPLHYKASESPPAPAHAAAAE
ncbi:3-hydroxyacyl-CoA dehydrogenase NAD-binding domain-containing protein [Hyphomicrobium sp. NDB2Meth4]|uniref:3-hydroxyacyl-CoA dehydrogenase NAD-binding domain-containing protein n=1 Tax=Hyphomicrobium sp. NDB2Meth4 TaxID=1892846 RepID=UPI00092FFB54|nr:3-hydroxyacyl-CoA dehydrogenase NAD-binding domain-containing protein [Hyphomicrobium sp. NDB2Meth4]